ncbi:MAG: DUF6285 domain-containing protein [Pseudomonadota bacterium]
MAQDNPNISELVATAREFIESIVSNLDGQSRYHALCSAFLLEVVERELVNWQSVETIDDKNLRNLLGEDVPHKDLLSRLCAAIREGRFDTREEELLQSMLTHVEAKLAVVKPQYPTQMKRG